MSTFIGEMIGYRPIILIKNGKMKVIERIRGDKNALIRLSELMKENIDDQEKICALIEGASEENNKNLYDIIKKGKNKRKIERVKVGASIAINSGPQAIGLAFLRKR